MTKVFCDICEQPVNKLRLQAQQTFSTPSGPMILSAALLVSNGRLNEPKSSADICAECVLYIIDELRAEIVNTFPAQVGSPAQGGL